MLKARVLRVESITLIKTTTALSCAPEFAVLAWRAHLGYE